MQEVICYKLDNGSIFEDKEKAIEAELSLNNRTVIDNRQKLPLKFKVDDIVYFASRNKIRQCKVIKIEECRSIYKETEDELYTQVILEDINDKEESEFAFYTTTYNTDLNQLIVTKFTDLCNFEYEKYL